MLDAKPTPEGIALADELMSQTLPLRVILDKERVVNPVTITDEEIDIPSCSGSGKEEFDPKKVLLYKENMVSIEDIDAARDAAGGSHFNRLCNICRVAVDLPKDAKTMVKQARIFDTDGSFTEMAEDSVTEGDEAQRRESFKRVLGWRHSQMNPYRALLMKEFYYFNLPYPIVAVEHRMRVSIYAVDWLEHVLNVTYFGIHGNGDLAFTKFCLWPLDDNTVNGLFYEFYDWHGDLKYLKKNNLEYEARMTCSYASKPDLLTWAADVAAIKRNIMFNAVTDFAQLHAVNQPGRFIMEEAPVDVERIMRNKTYPKTHERPLYIILTPRQIRKRMHLPEPEILDKLGRKVTPHERRGHYRVYRNARFKRAEDGSFKKRWVNHTWVGKSETVVDDRRYRVILEELNHLEVGTESPEEHDND